jgi:hypothetical protein
MFVLNSAFQPCPSRTLVLTVPDSRTKTLEDQDAVAAATIELNTLGMA